MIDFTKTIENRQRQNSVFVEGVEYRIRTEFYYWLAFEKLITADTPPLLDQLDYLYKPPKADGKGVLQKAEFIRSFIPENKQAGFEEMFKFYQYKHELPRPSKKKSPPTLDWYRDSSYIWAAFLQQYNKDLTKEDCHWHEFLDLFFALTDTKMNEIMSIRCSRETKGVMKELREAWALPIKRAKSNVPKMI